MRAKDFLLEYSQATTVQKMGAALASAVKKDPTAQRIVVYATVVNPELRDNVEFLARLALDNIENADPTPNKQYVQWLARVYANSWNKPTTATGTGMWLEDVTSTIAQYLHKFHELNRRKMIPPPENDINSFKDFNTFMYDMDQLDLPEKDEKVNKGSAFTLYEDDQWRVIVPQDQPAACYYGQGTRWCTAATRGNNMFAHYHGIAPLLIALPKDPDHAGEKYQMNFGISIDDQPMKSDYDIDDYINQNDDMSDSGLDEILDYGQIMDEQDDPVSMFHIQNRMHESWDGMINAYLTKFPDRKWQLYTNFEAAEGRD
jgi:hypothetical protein